MAHSRLSLPHRQRHKYELLVGPDDKRVLQPFWNNKSLGLAVVSTVLLAAFVLMITGSNESDSFQHCDTAESGFQCFTEISHFWGQYSPFFSVPTVLSADVPEGCEVTFAQILSRHGARDPTSSKSQAYNQTIQKIISNVEHYPRGYEFLGSYEYGLGKDQLTQFGQQQMVNSGIQFYRRYAHLAKTDTPFIRSASGARVVDSAVYWAAGFHEAKIDHERGDSHYPYPIVVISETTGSNNSLSHNLCDRFENGPLSQIGAEAQATWANVFVPPIQSRVNSALSGAGLTVPETIFLMDMCPFSTVASANGSTLSPFCALFTEAEWHAYAYYGTLGKYYSYGHGNPLGPTQGVGFTNELIARLTSRPVRDGTSTNHTLDDDPATFPLGRALYADFSHDTDMTAVLAALGLYNASGTELPLLPKTRLVEAPSAQGYSAAWTVPFAARACVEKMHCSGHPQELVRVVVNDRVLPLPQCDGDKLGRCQLSAFVDSLRFAQRDGDWDQCFR